MADNQSAEHGVRRIILIIAAVAVFTGTGLLLYIDYGAGLPSIPDASTGRIFEINVHGSILYVTKWEYCVPKIFLYGGVIVGFLARLKDIL
jgi:hypothetical protein